MPSNRDQRPASNQKDAANSESIREQAGPIMRYVHSVCHDTLPRLISFSLYEGILSLNS